jgi:hypothetical protein
MSMYSSRASRARFPESGRPSAAQLRTALYQIAAVARRRAVVEPGAPAQGIDVFGVAALSALDGAAAGEAFGSLFDEGDGETIVLARALGAIAGFVRGMALLEDGWRLRAGRPLR